MPDLRTTDKVLALLGNLAWDVLIVGLASIGFITLMYVAAIAFEPHYAELRDTIRVWCRNRGLWRVRKRYEYLPNRPRGDIEGLRKRLKRIAERVAS